MLIACLSLALARSAPFERLQLQWLDTSFRIVRQWQEKPTSTEVVIVGVDAASIGASGKPFALMLDEFALALDGLRLGKARALGVDLVFPDSPFDQLVPGAARRLALAIGRLRAAAPVVLGRLERPAPGTGGAAALYAAMAGAGGEGLLFVPADADGSLRRLGNEAGGELEALLAPRLALKLGQRPDAGIVDFSIGRRFDYVPLQTVVELAKRDDRAGLRQRFAGKVVLMGALLPDQDRQRLPVQLANWESGRNTGGVVFQAQAVRSLMQGAMIRKPPLAAEVLALLASVLVWRLRRRLKFVAAATLTLAAAMLGGSILLLNAGIDLQVTPALLALVLYAGWLGVQAYARQSAEQRRLRSIFSGYVSPAILDTILSGQLKEGRAGTRQPLAFLFADIRGFTAFCATTPPEQVIAFLNRYYSAITPALHRYGGTIDKFSGDGIMAFFGAPQPSDNPARDAIEAALAMLEALDAFNGELAATGRPPVAVGIGIAYGDAVLGNVGSPLRHDYTATGAATTRAAHIQQHCKKVPHALLVEQAAFELAQLAPSQCDRFTELAVELEKHGPMTLAAYKDCS
jgi:adenylate cyclase